MARKFVIEQVTLRADGYPEISHHDVTLVEEEKEFLFAGQEILVKLSERAAPILCEILEVTPELVRLKSPAIKPFNRRK